MIADTFFRMLIPSTVALSLTFFVSIASADKVDFETFGNQYLQHVYGEVRGATINNYIDEIGSAWGAYMAPGQDIDQAAGPHGFILSYITQIRALHLQQQPTLGMAPAQESAPPQAPPVVAPSAGEAMGAASAANSGETPSTENTSDDGSTSEYTSDDGSTSEYTSDAGPPSEKSDGVLSGPMLKRQMDLGEIFEETVEEAEKKVYDDKGRYYYDAHYPDHVGSQYVVEGKTEKELVAAFQSERKNLLPVDGGVAPLEQVDHFYDVIFLEQWFIDIEL